MARRVYPAAETQPRLQRGPYSARMRRRDTASDEPGPVIGHWRMKHTDVKRSPENLEVQENHSKEHCHEYLCVHKLLWTSYVFLNLDPAVWDYWVKN